MRYFTLILLFTLTLSYVNTGSAFEIPLHFTNLLIPQDVWDVIGPVMDRLLPTWVADTAASETLRAVLGGNLEAFHEAVKAGRTLSGSGMSNAFARMVQAGTLTAEKIEAAIKLRLSGISVNAVRRGVFKAAASVLRSKYVVSL